MNKVLTLNDFINELSLQRDKLSNNLKSMGVQTDIDDVKEKFNTLIEKILEINVNSGLTDEELSQTTATEDKVLNGFTFYSGNKTIKTGTALSSATTVDKTKLLKDITAYDNNGNLITGSALSEETTVSSSNMFTGIKAYDNEGNLITGSALSKETNVTAAKMFKGVTAYNKNGTLITGNPTKTTFDKSKLLSGYTAYNNNGDLITGEALNTSTTATASNILSGYTAYNNSGDLITGNISNYSGQTPSVSSTYPTITSVSSANYTRSITSNGKYKISAVVPYNGYYSTSSRIIANINVNVSSDPSSITIASTPSINEYINDLSGNYPQSFYLPNTYQFYLITCYSTDPFSDFAIIVQRGVSKTYKENGWNFYVSGNTFTIVSSPEYEGNYGDLYARGLIFS